MQSPFGIPALSYTMLMPMLVLGSEAEDIDIEQEHDYGNAIGVARKRDA